MSVWKLLSEDVISRCLAYWYIIKPAYLAYNTIISEVINQLWVYKSNCNFVGFELSK